MGFNGINADALIEIPIIKDTLNIQGSLRRSYADVLQTLHLTNLLIKFLKAPKSIILKMKIICFRF